MIDFSVKVIIMSYFQRHTSFDPTEYVALIYADRMRTKVDKEAMYAACETVFGHAPLGFKGELRITSQMLQVGHSFLCRCSVNPSCCSDFTFNKTDKGLRVLHHLLPYLESVMKCVEMNWMTILVRNNPVHHTVQMQFWFWQEKFDYKINLTSMTIAQISCWKDDENSIANMAQVLDRSIHKFSLTYFCMTITFWCWSKLLFCENFRWKVVIRVTFSSKGWNVGWIVSILFIVLYGLLRRKLFHFRLSSFQKKKWY